MIDTILSLMREGREYRYTVSAVILFCSVYIASRISKYGKDKICFHVTVIEFITYVRQQISFFCTPTNKIIAEYPDSALQSSGIFDKGGVDRNIYLDERGKKLLKDFLFRLGKSNVEDQIANCNYAIDGMRALLDEYKEEIPKKYKAYSTMAFIIGGMLVILLL